MKEPKSGIVMIIAWNTLLCISEFPSAEILHSDSLQNWEAIGWSYARSLLRGPRDAGRGWAGRRWWLRSMTTTPSRGSNCPCPWTTNSELIHPLGMFSPWTLSHADCLMVLVLQTSGTKPFRDVKELEHLQPSPLTDLWGNS